MPEKTVFDQYKEMIEKTKQLHSELVELSSKVGGIADKIDTDLFNQVAPGQSFSLPDYDSKMVKSLEGYPLEGASLKRHYSEIKD
ncbi:hypothetical protein [Methanococcoides sp. NM1]|uniref:hypothetical protein n=1 Tax=Methanococcoides sp. NM1 TaxID=1201013 RepID=UPI001082F457|nr:hypothetical protein [Methanococcoides sp. NM1]